MTRNPFHVTEDILLNNLLEEFLSMRCDSATKDDFEVMPLNHFQKAKYM